MSMKEEGLQRKLDELRKDWLKNPKDRKIIEIRGRLIKKAIACLKDKKKNIVEVAKDIFLSGVIL